MRETADAFVTYVEAVVASNLSLFAERRIVEIRMPTAKPGNAGSAAIVGLMESRDPDRLLLITAPRLGIAVAA